MSKQDKPRSLLLYSAVRGIYIPQDFVNGVRREHVQGMTAEDVEILAAGPKQEYYWETWDDILQRVKVIDPVTGVVYFLHQDGDLWAIPEGMEWDDNEDFYTWPDETKETN